MIYSDIAINARICIDLLRNKSGYTDTRNVNSWKIENTYKSLKFTNHMFYVFSNSFTVDLFLIMFF